MARVFLSYARQDAAKAKTLAQALERAGHEVWWDRHIRGGSRFSGAIEQALADADAVLVLWSSAAIKSPWVCDEASEGRESGRLVPITLDHCQPPLGFRQFQLIDFSRWSGRRSPKGLPELLWAIESAASGSAAAPEPDSDRAVVVRTRTRRRSYVLAVAALTVALTAFFGFAAWTYFGKDPAEAQAPTLAVLPFTDLSSEKDKAYFSEGVAEAILVKLGREAGIRVIGQSSSAQFRDAAAEFENIRRALGVTHVLEGSAGTAGEALKVNVRLISARDGIQIWAEEYQGQAKSIFEVQDEVARAVAKQLGRALAAADNAQSTAVTRADVYALYLAGRAKIRDRNLSELREALELAERVVSADPDYAPGHALYAEALWLLSDANYGRLPAAAAGKEAERYARRAIQLNPRAAEGYAALGMLLGRREDQAAAEKVLKRAITLDPTRADLRLWLSHVYDDLGWNQQAFNELRQALEVEPLSAPVNVRLSQTLSASGRFDEALRLIDAFESRGGSGASAAHARAWIAADRGDFSEALRYARDATRRNPGTEILQSVFAYPLGFRDLAAKHAAGEHPLVRLAYADQLDRLRMEARRLGPKLWDLPPSVRNSVLWSVALSRDWSATAQIYSAAHAHQICRGVDSLSVTIAFALRQTGYKQDAQRLINCIKRLADTHLKGPVRSPDVPRMQLAAVRAQIDAFEGNGARALSGMSRAVELGYRTSHGEGLAELPVFDHLRGEGAYKALDSKLKHLIKLERQQAIAAGLGSTAEG